MNRAAQTYREYPRSFWMMIGVNFIDRLGGSLLFPFFALYITQKFNVGMTQVGVIIRDLFPFQFYRWFPRWGFDRSLRAQGHYYFQSSCHINQYPVYGVCE